MWYYSLGQRKNIADRRGGAVSALINFIRYRMKELNKNQTVIADEAGIRESSLSYLLKKKDPHPRPKTIKGLAKALEVKASLLTSLLGYPTEPIPDIDERLYEIARRLLGAPWVVDRMDDLMRLPRDEFDDLMEWLDFQKNRAAGSGSQSKP